MNAFLRFVTGDWWIAIPMFLMSFTGVTLVIWRVLLNINSNTKMSQFLPAFQQRLDRDGLDAAINLCGKRDDVIPKRLYLPALQVFKQGQGLAAARRTMANAIELEILPDLNFLLPSILAIAKIATMVGLFGTVISMIGTFTAIEEATRTGGSAQAQSGAIGLALFATAMGLITAIPLVFSHVLLKSWVHQFETEMKKAALKLMLLLQAARSNPKKEAPTAIPGSAAKPADGAVRR